MDVWGLVLLFAGAIVIGLLVHMLATRHVGSEWTLAAAGAAAGGFFASEHSLGGLGAWGAEVAGLAIFPALIGALIVAAIVEGMVLLTSEESYS